MYELSRVQTLINVSKGNREKEVCYSVMLFGKDAISRQKNPVKIINVSQFSQWINPLYALIWGVPIDLSFSELYKKTNKIFEVPGKHI